MQKTTELHGEKIQIWVECGSNNWDAKQIETLRGQATGPQSAKLTTAILNSMMFPSTTFGLLSITLSGSSLELQLIALKWWKELSLTTKREVRQRKVHRWKFTNRFWRKYWGVCLKYWALCRLQCPHKT